MSTYLIGANAAPNRIPKSHFSIFEKCQPIAQGIVHRWKFPNGDSEATAIAESCRDLISRGFRPKDILILLSNQKALGRPIIDAFKRLDIAYSPPRTETFLDSDVGRLVYSLARIACNQDDYIAHRTILGVQTGVGAGTCNEICRAILENSLNFKDLFYKPTPEGVLKMRLEKALARVWEICKQIRGWKGDDTFAQRRSAIGEIVSDVFGGQEPETWLKFSSAFPDGITLSRLRDFLATDTEEQRANLLASLYEALGLDVPAEGLMLDAVRIMTMHGAKGLSGHVVFVPGLEEDIIPGPRRKPYPGLVMESARMLYVSITRARAACILSYAAKRFFNGKTQATKPSRFATQLNGPFTTRAIGLDVTEVNEIVGCRSQLGI